jgi:prolyl-tRNA editing enzyme YbaK/EbsC (Cys-tRNA(Pro) deacylase)
LYQYKNNIERLKDEYYFRFSLPFIDQWMVTQGYEGNITHKDEWSKALDFMILDKEMKSYAGQGHTLDSFYCYNKPVLAPADGYVQEVVDYIEDNGIEVGQIASSLIFKLKDGSPLLIITSGRHRVDTDLVARTLGVEKLDRVDADYVKEKSGFSIGGVAPIGWVSPATILIDLALNDYDIVWAAAGHPHAVYPTSFAELVTCTGAREMVVGP